MLTAKILACQEYEKNKDHKILFRKKMQHLVIEYGTLYA